MLKKYYRLKFYKNPLFTKRKPISRIKRKEFSYRKWFGLALLFIVIFIWCYLLFFSGYFRIKNIEVKQVLLKQAVAGAQETKNNQLEFDKNKKKEANNKCTVGEKDVEIQNNIKKMIKDQINRNKWLAPFKNNILLFSTKRLKSAILKKYYIDDLKIKKKIIDNSLIVSFKEKISAFMLINNNNRWLVDIDGNILKKIVMQNNNVEIGLPRVYNNSDDEVKIGENYFNKDFVKAILEFSNKDVKNFTYQIKNFTVNDLDGQSLIVHIINGPKIYFNIEHNLEKQVRKLNITIEKEIKDKFKKLNYIDLRFGQKVYYK